MSDYHKELKRAIRLTHGLEATYRETVPVTELWNGKPAWDGDVEVFDVAGHPKAKQCFAWGFQPEGSKEWEITAVLGVPPVTTPAIAVKVAIVAHARQATPRHPGKP
jgi:hypothetical protein